MSNVLYIGPYRQSDGWGVAAREYVRALVRTKHNITIQPIYLNSQKTYEKFEEFEKYENLRYSTYDTIVQHSPPSFYEKFVGHNNVGMCFFETNTIKNYWQNHIALMDKMIVCSHKEHHDLLPPILKTTSFDKSKNFLYSIQIPTDIDKFKRKYSANLQLPISPHTFKFYYVGEVTTRKNIQSLLVAFHSEFRPHELVDLVLKVNIVGQPEELSESIVRQEINGIKSLLGIYRDSSSYIKEAVISNYLSINDLYALHQQCDAYAIGSFGEAFSIPAFDAMAFGNYVIGNSDSGMNHFSKCSRNVMLTKSNIEPCLCSDKPMKDLYTAKDTWNRIDIEDLKIKMRDVFSRGKKKAAVNISFYSYDEVAQHFNQIL